MSASRAWAGGRLGGQPCLVAHLHATAPGAACLPGALRHLSQQAGTFALPFRNQVHALLMSESKPSKSGPTPLQLLCCAALC